MRDPVRLIRATCYLGAALDALTVVPMLAPKIGGAVFGIEDFHPGNDYRYAMMIGASLMLGWTFLLIWAAQKPVERRGVLLLTVFPVVVGLALAGGFAVAAGLIPIERMLPTWILQAVILTLFSYSYRLATRAGEASAGGTDRSA